MKTTIRKLQWRKQWPDALIALAGAWFAVSPWVLGLQESTAVLAVSLALGLALLGLAALALAAPRRWDPWAKAAVAAGAVASPWLLGFSDDPVAWRNAVAVGLVSLVLAAWLIARGEQERQGVLHGTEELAH